MGRYTLTDKEKWMELIDWMMEQEGLLVIGVKDEVVNIHTNFDNDTIMDLSELVFEMAARDSDDEVEIDKLH